MKMILFCLIIYFTSYVVQAEINDSDNDKYIEMLSEKEKEDFFSNVARRIADEVVPKFEPVGDVFNVSDEQLNTQNEYIRKLLEEERAKLRRRSSNNLLAKNKVTDRNHEKDVDVVVTTIRNANRRKRELLTTKSAVHLENNNYGVVPVKPYYDSASDDIDHDILVRNIKVASTVIPKKTSENNEKLERIDSKERTDNNDQEDSKAQSIEKQITNGEYKNVDEQTQISITFTAANTEAVNNASPVTETPLNEDTVSDTINQTRKGNSWYGDDIPNKNGITIIEHSNENEKVSTSSIEDVSSATLTFETVSYNQTEVTNIENSDTVTDIPAFKYNVTKSVNNERSKYVAATKTPNNWRNDLNINLNASISLAVSDNMKNEQGRIKMKKWGELQPVFKGYFKPGSNTYEVREIASNQVPFISIKKKAEAAVESTEAENKQYHYVPIYNYGLHNAVFEPKHRFESGEREQNDASNDKSNIDLDYYYMNYKTDHPVHKEATVGRQKEKKHNKKPSNLEMDYYLNRNSADYDTKDKLSQDLSLKEHFKNVRENLKKLKGTNSNDDSDIEDPTDSNDEFIFREHSEDEDTEDTPVKGDDVTDINSLLTVVEDMINLGNSALTHYDWLGTTVYIQTAIQKLSQVIDNIQDGRDVHSQDWDLFKYIVYLYGKCKLKREQSQKNLNLDIQSGKKLIGNWNNIMILVMPWKNKKTSEKSVNKVEKILGDFQDFLYDLYDGVSDLHTSIKEISPKIKYKNQNWFSNLKESYLKKPTKQQILSLLIHFFAIDLLDSIEETSLKNPEGSYVDILKKNGKNVKKTVEIFNVLLSFLEKLKK